MRSTGFLQFNSYLNGNKTFYPLDFYSPIAGGKAGRQYLAKCTLNQ